MSKYQNMLTARDRNSATLGAAVHPMALARLHQLFPDARVKVRHETTEVPRHSRMSDYRVLPEHETRVYVDLDGNDNPSATIFGKAICHPADNYDRRKGIDVAFRRALDIARGAHRSRKWEAAQKTQGNQLEGEK